MKVRIKHRCINEYFNEDKIAPFGSDRYLLVFYSDRTLDVSAIWRWIIQFHSGGRDASVEPYYVRSNEEKLH